MALQDYQKRVVTERDELSVKIAKLESFIASSCIYEGMPQEDKDLYETQLLHMQGYRAALSERISKF